jgi:uncharacterized protein YwqG
MSTTPERTGPLPAIALVANPGAGGERGASKLGGAPDVGPGFPWPSYKGRPLSFIAQVDLAAAARFPFASVLPSRGTLAFFYDSAQETWGFDPKDRGSWLVRHEPDPAVLSPAEAPASLPADAVYPEVALELAEIETIPPDEQQDDDEEAAVRHQLLGHPSPIQGEMELECQLVSHGLNCGDPAGYADPRAKALEAGAGQWRLLLQVDSDDTASMMWGDCGRLYFWITEDALRRRAFDECWMILQCC